MVAYRFYPVLFLLVLAAYRTSVVESFTSRDTNWGISSSSATSSNGRPSTVSRVAFIGSPSQVLLRDMTSFGTRSRLFASEDEVEETASEPLHIIIAGAPASGKGTQCEQIKEDYGVVHLSTGDMLRAAVAAKTEVGTIAKEYMDSGKLVPDDVIIGVVKDRLAESDCESQGWLLDGFPRTEAQAEALSDAGVTADCFLFLNVPDEVLVERVVGRRTDPVTGKIYHMKFSPPESDEVLERLEQRSDDTEEKVKVRLEQFHANVQAVQDSYKDIMVTIDGNQAPSVVSSAISETLNKVASA